MRTRRGVSSSAVSPSPRKAARRQPPPTPARSSPGDALDLPRDRAGYRRYLELLEAQGGGVSRAGARWLFEPESPALHLEHVVTKDQYETPAWLWRHYVALEHLTVDANATALNAVAPTYLTAADSPAELERLRDVGIWLNPAYGPKCTAIEPTLARLLATAVGEHGCTLVALLPLYSFKTWCVPLCLSRRVPYAMSLPRTHALSSPIALASLRA